MAVNEGGGRCIDGEGMMAGFNPDDGYNRHSRIFALYSWSFCRQAPPPSCISSPAATSTCCSSPSRSFVLIVVMYVIGVDGGTESLRAGVFDPSGEFMMPSATGQQCSVVIAATPAFQMIVQPISQPRQSIIQTQSNVQAHPHAAAASVSFLAPLTRLPCRPA